jgi:prolyl oligopeptidase
MIPRTLLSRALGLILAAAAPLSAAVLARAPRLSPSIITFGAPSVLAAPALLAPALGQAPALSATLAAPSLPVSTPKPVVTAAVPAAPTAAASATPAAPKASDSLRTAAADAPQSAPVFDGAKPPSSRRDESVVDDFFGTEVADPYRALEDPNSEETKAWVAAQNAHTRSILDALPGRDAIAARLKSLVSYDRYDVPEKIGKTWIYYKHTGRQDQAVLYKSRTLYGEPEILLDPNALSPDGTTALSGTSFSKTGGYMAYGISRNGSDWSEWKVRDVKTGRDLPDVIRWMKTGGITWAKDGSGFYYTRFAEPKPGEEYSGVTKDPKIYFHHLGTRQDQDRLVYERPDKPDWGLGAALSKDGRFLLVYQFEGTEPKNRVFVKDLQTPGAEFEPLFDGFDAFYSIIGSEGHRLFVQTTKDAPRGRLIAVDLRKPQPANWKDVIPQARGSAVLEGVQKTKDRFVAVWSQDAHQTINIYGPRGGLLREAKLPGIGSVSGFADNTKRGGYLEYTSYAHPRTVFHVNLDTGKLKAFRRPGVDFDPKQYEVKQVFYPSKDGTKIPMFIVHKKGLKLDGSNPTYLYGYGGFNVSLNPGFSSGMLAWMEMGGVYAVANLRGGGEYGQEWHDAGRLDKKQNVFDDFIAAGEHLIGAGYTSPKRLAIGGGSNGGLLVGAVLTQRPDLFGAAIPEVGVMDMLRFHLFTVGKAWRSDYGSAETKAGFDTLIKYSPLHNVKPGTRYPATMVMTGDHDDRVVPAHSHKFTATLQAAQAGSAPILTRIESNAGHGAGTPISKWIAEVADKWAFLMKALGLSEKS